MKMSFWSTFQTTNIAKPVLKGLKNSKPIEEKALVTEEDQFKRKYQSDTKDRRSTDEYWCFLVKSGKGEIWAIDAKKESRSRKKVQLHKF